MTCAERFFNIKLIVYAVSFQLYYPINVLRNIALRETRTDYVFVIDVDFIPMPGLHEYFIHRIQYLESEQKKKRVSEP